MDLTGLVVVAAGILAYGLVSRRLEGTVVTLPIVFVGFGWAVGDGGFGIAPVAIGHGVIHAVAEITLVVVLFADAARIDLKTLVRDHTLPQRMLLIGLPGTIVLGAVFSRLIFPESPWPLALLLAAILAPTDAALGQSVVSSRVVPVRIRQALNVESGLNDGIVLPVVLVFAIWAGAPAHGGDDTGTLAIFALKQVTLGPLVGVACGYLGARLLDFCADRSWISGPFEGIEILAIIALSFTGAELVGGNGFIAAFASGLVFGSTLRRQGGFLFEFMESEGQLLTLLTFFIFGAAMLPIGLDVMGWGTVLYALLSLTLARAVPVFLSLIGSGLSVPSKLFLGWFGPRGLASILFALLILEEYPLQGAEELFACVVLTVGLSVLLHGVSAAPLSNAYGRMVARSGECEETKPVPEMPLRHGGAGKDG